MHRPLRIVLLAVALTLIATACTDGDGADPVPPTTGTEASPSSTTTSTSTTAASTTSSSPDVAPLREPGDCRFTVPEGRDPSCGFLVVPENRSNPSGATVRLHYAVFPSESNDPAPDPVVYLEGGPGGEALELLALVFDDIYAHLLADRDLVIFDQRGTGFSEPSLACPEAREYELDTLDDDLPIDEVVTGQLAAIQACRDRLLDEGVDLNAYTSAENAADITDLLTSLGYEEWNLYGISYGTRLALTAMRDHPEGIRSVILDSVYPPEVDVVTEAAANLDRALDTLFATCVGDAVCSTAYPNLEQRFYSLVETLDASPIRAPVTNVFTGEVYDAVFSGGALGGVVFQSLYSADAIPVIPQMIANVEAGDTYELSVLTSSFLANGEFLSLGMLLSVQCYEESGFTSPAEVSAALDAFPELETVFVAAPNVGPPFFDICSSWGTRQAPSLENEPVTSGIPTLVMAGEFDPITPPLWGRLAARSLSSSFYVEFPGQGHGPSTADACPQSIMRSFLGDPIGEPDTACTVAMEPPAFLTNDTPSPPVSMIPYEDSLFGSEWSGVVPDGWERQAPGTWARLTTGFDQAAVIQQFAAGTPSGFLLAALAVQFGLGDDPEPTGEYLTETTAWTLYDGSLVGTPATLALGEVAGGTFLVALVTPPREAETLRLEVLFPVLDAIEVN